MVNLFISELLELLVYIENMEFMYIENCNKWTNYESVFEAWIRIGKCQNDKIFNTLFYV